MNLFSLKEELPGSLRELLLGSDKARTGHSLFAAKQGASFRFSFESRLVEFLRAAGEAEPVRVEPAEVAPQHAAKAEEAPTKEAPLPKAEAKGREAEAGKKREAKAEAESKDDDAAEVPDKDDPARAAEGTAEAETPPAEKQPTTRAEAVHHEATKEVAVDRRAIREVRLEAHVKLARALTAEEIEAIRKRLRGIVEELDEDPAAAAADFVRLVAELVGGEEKAKRILEVKDADELASARDRFAEILRRLAELFERVAREKDGGERDVIRLEGIEAATTAPDAEASDEEAARRAVERLVAEVDRRKKAEEGGKAPHAEVSNKNTPEAPAAEARDEDRTARSAYEELLERAKKRSKEARAEVEKAAPESEGSKAERIVHREVEAIYVAGRTRTSVGGTNGLPLQAIASAKVEGAGEARSGGGQSPSWQNAYDKNTRQAETHNASARTGYTTGARREQIFNQIVREARMTFAEGKGEATLRLKPEFLGKVRIKVEVEQGKVHVHVRAEQAVVTRLLSDHLNELKEALERSGLEPVVLDVSTGMEDAGARREGTGGRTEEEDAHPSWLTEGLDADGEAEQEAPPPRAAWLSTTRHEFVA